MVSTRRTRTPVRHYDPSADSSRPQWSQATGASRTSAASIGSPRRRQRGRRQEEEGLEEYASGRSRSPSSAQDFDSDSSEPASDVSDPDENGDDGGEGLMGVQLAIFEVRSATVQRTASPVSPTIDALLDSHFAFCQVERMPGFSEEAPLYSITLLGVQLRRISRAALCCMLLLGIFGTWFMHGYFEERLSHGEKFPMELLTLIQFSSVVRKPLPSFNFRSLRYPTPRLLCFQCSARVAQALLSATSKGLARLREAASPAGSSSPDHTGTDARFYFAFVAQVRSPPSLLLPTAVSSFLLVSPHIILITVCQLTSHHARILANRTWKVSKQLQPYIRPFAPDGLLKYATRS